MTETETELRNLALVLFENLKDMVRRFEGCLINNGTSQEYARGSTVHAKAAIARAEKILRGVDHEKIHWPCRKVAGSDDQK